MRVESPSLVLAPLEELGGDDGVSVEPVDESGGGVCVVGLDVLWELEEPVGVVSPVVRGGWVPTVAEEFDDGIVTVGRPSGPMVTLDIAEDEDEDDEDRGVLFSVCVSVSGAVL
ncbi:hypothetical protein [Amycolatopsis taiwanensis]|uniref:Uncharacterized protein n=1 Tax=Amycolatopsis taiwanensis TaxID=342230 RepID=A0A9W6R262_9PSEU|nr:hypothetical protein [Amycolatopsis taiwanensis]GLY67020.1 hypothetical protein Atai01_36390 [Amycolatopsis taiwanensis]